MQFGTSVGGGVTRNCGGQGGVAGAVMGNVGPVVVGEEEKWDERRGLLFMIIAKLSHRC